MPPSGSLAVAVMVTLSPSVIEAEESGIEILSLPVTDRSTVTTNHLILFAPFVSTTSVRKV